VEIVQVTEEDEYFPPPRNLRDLISTIDAAATLTFGGPVDARPPTHDRSLHASDVLASLA
jgi:4-hydroxy-3-methylbut-2-enyl diphosphate reductase